MIKPTVGRVVWYYEGESGPLAAHVCKVHSDSMVNLMVIGEDGVPFSRVSVVLVHGDAPPAGYPHCRWMPYQLGQAAKTEALQKAVEEGFRGR